MSQSRFRTVFIAAVLLLTLGVLTACMGAGPRPLRSLRQYQSNGERIYYTGTSANGPIRYNGGNVGGMMGGAGMMGGGSLACADCHGNDARGGSHFMHMQFMDAPDIRWSALTEAEHGGDGDHAEGGMDHPPYNEFYFKQAVTQGLDPSGAPLDSAMPRWRMSDQDIADLIAFLKTK